MTLQKIWKSATFHLSMSLKKLSTFIRSVVESARHVSVLLLLAVLITCLTFGCLIKRFGLKRKGCGKGLEEQKS
jgi:TRAP-type C4-dicarboxylate transport system permease large subunit